METLLLDLWRLRYLILAGLFMALQPKIIACGKSVALYSMAVRFLVGPAVIAVTSIATGLRGDLLHVAIVQVHHPNLVSNHFFFSLLDHLSSFFFIQYNCLICVTSCQVTFY